MGKKKLKNFPLSLSHMAGIKRVPTGYHEVVPPQKKKKKKKKKKRHFLKTQPTHLSYNKFL
jgi:hypothetical protein